MDNTITIFDYTERGNSVYINAEVFDAVQNNSYIEEVRFLGDLLYGDLVHATRSPLSEKCRKQTVEYLRQYFNR